MTGNNRRAIRTTIFAFGSVWSVFMTNILMPVTIRNAPNTYRIQWNSAISFAPIANHHAAQDQGTEHTPEQDSVLVDRRHRKETEEHGDDEDVVHAQRFLQHVSGEVLDRGRSPVVDLVRRPRQPRRPIPIQWCSYPK